MPENRIRELREAARLTQEELAERTQISVAHISRMENGKRGVSRKNARKIATALGKEEAEVYGFDQRKTARSDPRGVHNDLVEYQATPSDPFSGLKTRNKYLMQVTTTALERIGIRNGDVVVVDGSTEACKNPPAMAAVRVRYALDPKRPSKNASLLRQFVPPSLLITNSGSKNAASIDMEVEDAEIIGVIVSAHRALHA
jgi:transcriptional regulator with XRE-family HTH domain